MAQSPAFVTWTHALVARHQEALSFAEVRRGLQALSAQYVARRLHGARAPLEGRGKRAAFAAYYAPMHYVAVAHAAHAHNLVGAHAPDHIVDLGCGTGVGAAAWAATHATPHAVMLEGHDLNAWALAEARWNWGQLGLRGRTIRGDLTRVRPRPPAARGRAGIVCAFSLNELDDAVRDQALQVLLQAARDGHAVLVLEPIARAVAPWWPAFVAQAEALGGAAQEHKVASPLPPHVQQLGRAAGLDTRLLSCRSLALAPPPGRL